MHLSVSVINNHYDHCVYILLRYVFPPYSHKVISSLECFLAGWHISVVPNLERGTHPTSFFPGVKIPSSFPEHLLCHNLLLGDCLLLAYNIPSTHIRRQSSVRRLKFLRLMETLTTSLYSYPVWGKKISKNTHTKKLRFASSYLEFKAMLCTYRWKCII